MINILYIHGLGSSSESSTGKLLVSLSNEKYKIYSPSFSLSPKKAIEEVNRFIKDNNIELVIGSSLGGFYALQSNCERGVVINPAMTPTIDIVNAIGYGEHDYSNGEGKYVIDENFISELRLIINRNYNIENAEENWFKNFDKNRSFAGIFGGKDELFSHYEDFSYVNNKMVVFIEDMHHRFDKAYVSVLMEMIEAVLKDN